MHILVIGNGGREHALAWKVASSPLVKRLTVAPGNPGTAGIAENVDLKADEIVGFAKAENVNLVIVGPEVPLANGLADDLQAAGIPCFGPTKDGAQLETSKSFMKDLAAEAGVPTAQYQTFTDAAPAKAFLRSLSAPYVIKADGLAAGKGVIIAQGLQEAEDTIDNMLSGQFGAASQTVVIEEFLRGTELSVFAVTDGETLLHFGAAQDHKRAFDNDEGPNTGGMGGFSPTPLDTPENIEAAYSQIIRPTLDALRKRGITYRGVLYAGLMMTADGPKLIEYNVRFGDPECQILMRRIRSDIMPALWGAATGRLAGVGLDFIPNAAANIVIATRGYPDKYEKGSIIAGIKLAEADRDVVVFHAGTALEGDHLTAAGGRVLNVTATGTSIGDALNKCYDAAAKIDWPEGFYRTDIGKALR
ncbi:phosphoribosylamine--glycine ligase [Parvularcula sp. LCG005]|uniref:phosphoribosylamine--glycine ligase n=1 Tax=Parvularcula sp. LCG005 TaxID=3078805 RepID=UPI002943F7B1|nr:phosphoribosylamine--glycine ligase [Parvularcula sp. LCG005]WOI52629.1 phosphoribosylamine--glycine ligase [Parvularcula sp. LCG005]